MREQLRIAANEPLALEQSAVKLEGASLECRINAEDPARGFQPTPGRLDIFELARDRGPGRVRVDTHLRAGDEVSPFYDSLLAKVVTWGQDRDRGDRDHDASARVVARGRGGDHAAAPPGRPRQRGVSRRRLRHVHPSGLAAAAQSGLLTSPAVTTSVGALRFFAPSAILGRD